MSNKTISINPSLFSVGGKTKTKKNTKKKTTITPLISPNILKKKLLKRIKEHKQRETLNLDNKKKDSDTNTDTNTNIDIKQNSDSFSDEFSNSINYLQTLSKQKKINDEKINYEKQKQIRKENLERKTLKHYQSNNNVVQHYVNIELPEELKIHNTDNLEATGGAINLEPYKYDVIPYGILKGGIKPTYRTWARTQRNNIVTNPNSALTIQGGQINREKNERENRLNNLREKLKQKQLENTIQKIEEVDQKNTVQQIEDNILSQNLIQKPLTNIVISDTNIQTKQPIDNEEIIAIKKITKKTIKRTYTLGKSNIKNRVSILVKDRGTRKNVLNAHKELKKKNINDVKTYLREHNLIKIGSNAPNDIIRKLYESSMLSGEITNSNSEILLHNFSKDDKEV